ncbi:DUF6140 family protein [Lutibacter sp.]|uniref:DUF6140 family protein n=1 Tax=Lutibacter sp. TaxID=1925666 RepID=UPI003569D9ED
MATFEIKTKQTINVNGEYVDKGLSVQVTTMFANPFDEVEKIHKAFMRVHGIDFKKEGYLSPGYFEYERV